jgi:hypothetical protein
VLGGAGGGALVRAGPSPSDSFWLFTAGNLLLGVYQAFANYHRFAAADAASPAFESQAISLVLAGGVIAAFLGPLNASRTNDLLPGLTDAGPYAIIVALALLGSRAAHPAAHPRRRGCPHRHQRPMREIRRDPAFRVARAGRDRRLHDHDPRHDRDPAGDAPRRLRAHPGRDVMQWHVLGMFAPPSSPATSSPASVCPTSCSPAPTRWSSASVR